ncbi:MAG: YdeI family protein [Salibacteraceae bacterium]
MAILNSPIRFSGVSFQYFVKFILFTTQNTANEMKSSPTVDDYIKQHPEYEEELRLLRSLLQKTGLEECVKWGVPHYQLDNKTIIGMAAFKTYVGLWFHQGVFLSDPDKVLINAQKDKTRGLRQMRFKHIGEINSQQIARYIDEAIANHKAGKGIKPQKRKLVLPQELKDILLIDSKLRAKFEALTPGRQREYADYIGGAKQSETRIGRLKKCIPMIMEGVGLNDRYRK